MDLVMQHVCTPTLEGDLYRILLITFDVMSTSFSNRGRCARSCPSIAWSVLIPCRLAGQQSRADVLNSTKPFVTPYIDWWIFIHAILLLGNPRLHSCLCKIWAPLSPSSAPSWTSSLKLVVKRWAYKVPYRLSRLLPFLLDGWVDPECFGKWATLVLI
jgi:hypothetical protein